MDLETRLSLLSAHHLSLAPALLWVVFFFPLTHLHSSSSAHPPHVFLILHFFNRPERGHLLPARGREERLRAELHRHHPGRRDFPALHLGELI